MGVLHCSRELRLLAAATTQQELLPRLSKVASGSRCVEATLLPIPRRSSTRATCQGRVGQRRDLLPAQPSNDSLSLSSSRSAKVQIGTTQRGVPQSRWSAGLETGQLQHRRPKCCHRSNESVIVAPSDASWSTNLLSGCETNSVNTSRFQSSIFSDARCHPPFSDTPGPSRSSRTTAITGKDRHHCALLYVAAHSSTRIRPLGFGPGLTLTPAPHTMSSFGIPLSPREEPPHWSQYTTSGFLS